MKNRNLTEGEFDVASSPPPSSLSLSLSHSLSSVLSWMKTNRCLKITVPQLKAKKLLSSSPPPPRSSFFHRNKTPFHKKPLLAHPFLSFVVVVVVAAVAIRRRRRGTDISRFRNVQNVKIAF